MRKVKSSVIQPVALIYRHVILSVRIELNKYVKKKY